MKNMKKTLALFLVLTMCLGLLTACGGDQGDTSTEQSSTAASEGSSETPAPSSDEVEEVNDTLVVSVLQGLEGKFSPFFYSSADDGTVVDTFTLYTLLLDRVAGVVNHGIDGETRNYNGTDYTYTGPADVTVTENEDGTVTYTLKMRDDIVFSDGVPATIDDVIFGIYVYLDPTYEGSATLYSVPIVGLDEYRKGMDTLMNLLIAAGRDNTDFSLWEESVQTQFWSDYDTAVDAFIQGIIDYLVDAGANTAEDDFSLVAPNWGYELPEGATKADWFEAMLANYDSLNEMVSTELGNVGFADSMPNYDSYTVGIETGESAPNVSGIQRVDDYTLTLTTSELDATAIYQMGLPIAPLHWYGDESLYDYDNDMFGFKKGDLSIVKAKTTTPLGAGPYIFNNYSNGVVYMDANPSYYKGEPQIAHLNYLESLDDSMVPGIVAGTLDVASPSYSTTTAKQIAVENGFGEDGWENLEGPVITTILIDYRGYGYIGCNPNLVKVGNDPYSEQSKDLRKAINTLIAVYRDEAIDSYYGETASVINYPISSTSWAAPQSTDDGYRIAYSVDVNGNDIYTAGMSAEEKYAAALQASLGFFEAAGYTVEDGKITAAPEGAKLGFQVEIGGNGSGDHPSFLLLKNVSDVLAGIGITLTINDHVDASALYATYQNGTAEFWCAAWQSGSDPDMYQLYHSKGSTNYYHISDPELDDLIMKGRASTDQNYRKTLYQSAMDIIMDYGVEIPIYQRSDCIAASTERVDVSTFPGDMTPYWGWMSEVEGLAVK